MKTIVASMMAMAAVAACGLLNGCLSCNCTNEPVYEPIVPMRSASNFQTVVSPTNLPLNYQWYSTNGNAASFTVQAGSGTNGALYYQWYNGTNN